MATLRTRMRCLYVFNRNGVCLHYHVWLRPLCPLNPEEDQKLLFGLLYSLKSFVAKMDPLSKESSDIQIPGQGCSFHSFRTNTYKLHILETPSGIKFILVTDPRIGDLRNAMNHIYNIYVEYVVKNPLYEPGQPFSLQFIVVLSAGANMTF